tara:strand:- start:361 stop:519 length:159 start_codon:yes stop_codon:yes gene_type:complete
MDELVNRVNKLESEKRELLEALERYHTEIEHGNIDIALQAAVAINKAKGLNK